MQHPPIFQLLEDETFHCNKKWCQQQSRRAFTSFLCSRRFFINSHALHTEASWETYHPTCMHIFRWIELSSVTTHDKFAIIPPVNFQHISRRRGASKRISHRSMCVWVHKSHKNEWNIFDTFDGTASRRYVVAAEIGKKIESNPSSSELFFVVDRRVSPESGEKSSLATRSDYGNAARMEIAQHPSQPVLTLTVV